MKSKAPILQKQDAYIFKYPQAIKFAEDQSDIFWLADEIALEKDIHDLRTVLTEAELHGVTTVLRLFTEYELKVGADYWLSRMMRTFKRPELQRMFSVFGMMELNVHAPFYAKINELLGLNTDEFYTSYVQTPVLKDRMDHIQDTVGAPVSNEYDLLKSIGAFSIVEGAILYSNFAFLKHFQSEGKNKLMNLVAGINFSVRDENLHSLAGAWLFRELLRETDNLGEYQAQDLVMELVDFCHQVYDHEERIINMIFEKGLIKGITDHQLKNFVKARLNLCMEQLGLKDYLPFDPPTYDPISKWFYKNVTSSQLHDFFAKTGNSYNRDWRESEFTW